MPTNYYRLGCQAALVKLGVDFNNPRSSPGASAVSSAESAMGTVGNIAGGVAGGALGTALGGPVGAIAGSVAGGYLGEKTMSQAPRSIKQTAQQYDKTYNSSLQQMNAATGMPGGGRF